jgi:hypothetical protein
MRRAGFILALVATIILFPLALTEAQISQAMGLAVCSLCVVGFDRCGGNGPRTDRSLP